MNDLENKLKSLGAVVLAAGKSHRMQSPKPFLKFSNKLSFIEKIIAEYLEFNCKAIVVVINNSNNQWDVCKLKYKSYNTINFVENTHLEYERFYSVQLALTNIVDVDYCFIQNADNPFIDNQILEMIYSKKTDAAYLVPVYKGRGGHPILLNRKAISVISNEAKKDANLKVILKSIKRINVEVNTNNILININKKSDYTRLFPEYNDRNNI